LYRHSPSTTRIVSRLRCCRRSRRFCAHLHSRTRSALRRREEKCSNISRRRRCRLTPRSRRNSPPAATTERKIALTDPSRRGGRIDSSFHSEKRDVECGSPIAKASATRIKFSPAGAGAWRFENNGQLFHFSRLVSCVC